MPNSRALLNTLAQHFVSPFDTAHALSAPLNNTPPSHWHRSSSSNTHSASRLVHSLYDYTNQLSAHKIHTLGAPRSNS